MTGWMTHDHYCIPWWLQIIIQTNNVNKDYSVLGTFFVLFHLVWVIQTRVFIISEHLSFSHRMRRRKKRTSLLAGVSDAFWFPKKSIFSFFIPDRPWEQKERKCSWYGIRFIELIFKQRLQKRQDIERGHHRMLIWRGNPYHWEKWKTRKSSDKNAFSRF